MSPEEQKENIADLISKSLFEIGGADQTEKVRSTIEDELREKKEGEHIYDHWADFLKDLQIKIGTLLKADSVSFLMGAGTSKSSGGVLLGSIPTEIENFLFEKGVINGKVTKWLELFYIAVRSVVREKDTVPQNKEDIVKSLKNTSRSPIGVNYESVLSSLYKWRSALTNSSAKLILGNPEINVTSKDLDDCLNHAKDALIKQCILKPKPEGTHKTFLKKVLTRPLNLKRLNLFTLNYDTLVEQAADAEGIVLIDGFVGAIERIFRPESYDQDLYFPAETTEGRVHRLDRVVHFYKLHGSVNWYAKEPDWDNPYGVSVCNNVTNDISPVLIYPTPLKYGETVGMPYSELFRRFAWAIVRPQSTLFVIGYGFGDEHVNAIIRQALAVPSFTVVVVDPFVPVPDASSDKFVGRLRSQGDRRVWIVSGETLGKFEGFVKYVLPDLRDEEILEKVMKTYKALRHPQSGPLDMGEPNGK
jgi:hypothetical protein